MDKFSVYVPKLLPQDERFVSGRRSCKGCGKALAARLVTKAADAAVISEEVLKARFPELVSLNAQSYALDDVTCDATLKKLLASIDHINASAAQQTKTNHKLIKKAIVGINRQVFMSDYLALSQLFQQRKEALYVCFDNERSIDTLISKAAPKPFILAEDRHPVSNEDIARILQEKQIPPVVAEAGFSYTATACSSLPFDLIDKVKKGLACSGNAFILVLTPCPTGWVFAPEKTIAVGLKAVQTGYFPLYEISDGSLRITERLQKQKPVQEFLMAQKRFIAFPPKLIPAVQAAVDAVYADLLQKEQ